MRPRLLLATLVLLLGASAPVAAARDRATARDPFVCKEHVCRGYISVPLDYSGVVPGRVQLFVSKILPSGPSKGTVFLVAGGPGQSASYAFGTDAYDPWSDYTEIVYDDRGTGQSSRVACGPFASLEDDRDAIGRCSDLLGPEGGFYSTRANVADMDSIRQLLGVDRIAIWGTSYGTKQALAYARAYPTHVERLLLDSPLLPDGPDPFRLGLAKAVPAGIASLCGHGRCARATADPAGDVVAVANALAAKPAESSVRLVTDDRETVRVTGPDVVALATETDVSTALARVLPAALRAAREGRPAELQRIWLAETDGYDEAPDQTSSFSEPVFAATLCNDGLFPWSSQTPVAARPALFDQAVAAFGPDAFAPLGPWLARSGPAYDCLDWAPPATPPLGGAFPDVPTLVVSGERDIRTPTVDARKVAALFPHGKLVVVGDTGHSVLSFSTCALEAAHDWLAGGPVASSCPRNELMQVALAMMPYVPANVGSARALRPGGKIGRTEGAVVATLQELYFMTRLTDADDLAGIVGGGTDEYDLESYSDVPGVAVTGEPVFINPQRVTVGGAVRGRLAIDWNPDHLGGSITGVLGGRKISSAF